MENNNLIRLTLQRIVESCPSRELAKFQVQVMLMMAGIGTISWTPEIKAKQIAMGIKLTHDEEIMPFGTKIVVLEEVVSKLKASELQLLIDRQGVLISYIDEKSMQEAADDRTTRLVKGEITAGELAQELEDNTKHAVHLEYAADRAMAEKYSPQQMADTLHSQLAAVCQLIHVLNQAQGNNIGYGVIMADIMSNPVIDERFKRLDSM